MVFSAPGGADYTTSTRSEKKGVWASPDYKALYLEMFRASEQAIRLLQDAQARAEQALLQDGPPPLHLPPRDSDRPD